MAVHVHSPTYVRPDDRGRCTHTWKSFGYLVQCDSPEVAGSGLCLTDFVARELHVDRDTATALITEAHHHTGGTT